jgi:hypothetical protein
MSGNFSAKPINSPTNFIHLSDFDAWFLRRQIVGKGDSLEATQTIQLPIKTIKPISETTWIGRCAPKP